MSYRKGCCKCGCGEATSSWTYEFKRGHRPLQHDVDFMAERIDFDAPNGCWNWTGMRFPNEYGMFRRPERVVTTAHRAVWEEVVGEVSDTLEVDHLCRNKRCVNPDHLEPVTTAENLRRAGAPKAAIRARRERAAIACPKGHPNTPENRYPSGACKPCGRAASLRYYHARKAAQR